MKFRWNESSDQICISVSKREFKIQPELSDLIIYKKPTFFVWNENGENRNEKPRIVNHKFISG